MKIGFINHSSSLYGANRSLVNLIEGLRSHDVKPFVILRESGELVGLLKSLGVEVAFVPYKLWAKKRGRVTTCLAKILGETFGDKKRWDDINNIEIMVTLLKGWGVDLVQSNSSIFPAGYFAAKKLNLPHIWHLREFIENYGFSFELGEKQTKKIINSSDACIAISNSVAETYFDDKSSSLKRVIYNGVLSSAQFLKMKEKSVSIKKREKEFVFGAIGHIQASKHFDVAIRALSLVKSEFPDVRLMIAGSGAVAPLKKLAVELGVESNVKLLGLLKNPFGFYLNIDALLMCSQKEAMGRVTVEANAACKPVIGFDNVGTSELIAHGKTGFLYKDGAEALADCMKTFLNNRELSVNMGMSAWDFAHKKFNTEVYADEFYQIVDELLSVKSKS